MERKFYVDEGGHQSELRPLCSGITQGCTLSPLLFVVVMTVLMTEARSMLSKSAQDAYASGLLSDLAYADDTLLLGVAS